MNREIWYQIDCENCNHLNDIDVSDHVQIKDLRASNAALVACFQWDSEMIARLRASNAALVGALEAFMHNEAFMVERGLIPDVRDDILWVNARAAIAAAKGEK